ncbi:DUF2520 domain-containing protein [Halosquirtibacter xylanolyticus]|uniref:Rossmann-like and DUF2520 domain-containing protein n=1 Tax=Halosquirtibacter xylanolyticus TaxID=3374599 RepID=UPI0037494202|nr:DUF2520 domain-containing protein [Prolixibacteraceae bacterium]
MSSHKIFNVSFIGAGNVATQLALNLYQKSYNIKQIYSRTLASAVLLSEQVEATPITQLEELSEEVDLVILSVSDKAMPLITNKLLLKETLLVHTAGSIPMDLLYHCSERIGVLYPTQTFTKTHHVKFDNIPLCIEANNHDDLAALLALSTDLSTKVNRVSSDQRKVIHLAAVFACNFSNHMLAIADELLSKESLSLDILEPLVEETIKKAFLLSPKEGQSGPAVRRDTNVIQDHLKRLENQSVFSDIYKKVTDSIQSI